jgi:protoporphyrinogen IX oxidase
MIYLWLKAVHVAAVLCWTGGLLTAAVTIAARSTKLAGAASDRTAAMEFLSRWDRRVTAPAMLAVWGAGLTLAMLGSWFPSPWLIFKLCIVTLLSALHGMLSGILRRLGRPDTPPPPSWLRHAPMLIVVGVIAIAVLVIVKPI